MWLLDSSTNWQFLNVEIKSSSVKKSVNTPRSNSVGEHNSVCVTAGDTSHRTSLNIETKLINLIFTYIIVTHYISDTVQFFNPKQMLEGWKFW